MASFDASEAQAEQVGRVASLENNMGGVMAELHRLQTAMAQQAQHAQNVQLNQNAPQYVPPPPPRPNLNLPEPPGFSGIPSELPSFKLKLCQFLRGNYNTYFDSQSQLMYAGSLLTGDADEWYMNLVDHTTYNLPPHYDLDSFLQAMTDFFGGGITLASRERSLDTLRQTGTVQQLAIAFQNITNTFTPRWTDHPLIYVLSKKIREPIRFELAARGTVPLLFHDYVAAAISVEQNQAAANNFRGQPQPQPPRLPYKPPPALPAPAPRSNPPPQAHVPMDLDGMRARNGGALSQEERRRRAEGNLCAYCGQPGHIITACPRRNGGHQARGIYPVPSGYPSDAGYHPPPGFQLIPQFGTFPTPWTQVPSPHTQFGNPPAALPAPDASKNARPSQ